MNVWNLALAAAFIATAASGTFYIMAGNVSRFGDPSALSPVKSKDRARNMAIARSMMGISFAFIAVASAGLLSMFLRHDFRFEYVVNNSSRGLDNIYLVSAFWAGQEGSLLLWALFSGFFGCMLMLTARKNEESSMPWYALAHLVILAVTLRMSPFTMLAEPAADGIGLNPLLMNPWMAIHPPIIFAGYAAIAAPYALAMGALTRKDYHGWVPVATGSADLVSYMSPESKIRNIDIAAGTAMIREAGGEVLDSVHSPINMGLDVTIRDRFYASCDRKILEELR